MNNKTFSSRKIAALVTGSIALIICAVVVFLNFEAIFKPNKEIKTASSDFVEVIDVGQGDSILISSQGTTALIDTGLYSEYHSVAETLSKYDISKIDVLLITHLHDDHAGALGVLSEIYTISNLILPEVSIESESLGVAELAIDRVVQSGGEVYTAKQGMNFSIGKFELTVLAAFDRMRDENNRSLIVMAEMEGKKFLFTGDIEKEAEKALLKEDLNIKCDVLKVAHHGSSTSSTIEFLKACNPKMVAISVGFNNSYGHPHNEILALFEKRGYDIYRTDQMGNIIFTVKNKMITVAKAFKPEPALKGGF